ncbi:MAG: hypothetical protein WCD88_06350 [Desulfobacterales bacterium]
MGLCKDEATTYLKGLGYNVIRVPQQGIEPLQLIGRQKKMVSVLGPLNLLVTNPPGELPPITRNQAAADINGRTSSRLSLGLGATILGNIIGAMGGNLGVNVDYTDAKGIRFVFQDVLADSLVPLEVGNYLRACEVDAGNLILKEYVLGNGELFLVTKTIKSDTITVTYDRDKEAAVKVDVPALQEIVGGNVSVRSKGGTVNTVTYKGRQKLPFGFQCLEVGVYNGELNLIGLQAGEMFLSLTSDADTISAQLAPNGLLDIV